mgnify:CR=1 FL=1
MSKLKIDPTLVRTELNLELLQNLQIYQHPITLKYQALGGPGGWLGPNTTPINKCPDGVGSYQHYANGSIYYHPSTGAHEVHGLIRARWQSLGWESSATGRDWFQLPASGPVTPPMAVPNQVRP